ncbi:enoyl-CoA hydratase/isomerase family protein [Haloarchaeobius sp. DFWS5]|uniref:enoyl-CoA hydratase/isomerase family protein n=1 Tax=Haloarchaeobius sp. DFWS5 TaxID=3446114 RepID=UPI003EB8A2E8
MTESLPEVATEFETVSVDVRHEPNLVATVTIDRPDARNAMNVQVRSELKDAFDAIEDSDVRAVILTGSDDAGTFVAGADVTELRERTALEQRAFSKRPRVYEHVENLRQPVVARINGHALGGGCELAMACDVRVAREGSKVGLPEITLGLFPGGGGTQRLPRLVGEGRAMELILTGAVLDAEEAEADGLVDHVYTEESFDDEVDALADRMARHSPVALEFAKRAVQASGEMDLRNGVEYEAELFAQLLTTDDVDEGISAFLEDRDPEWTGE